ncbi:MAG TPA: phosphoglucosamine mutase [Agitococcus sp.]|nr:phosphoglucosamine mutase [Moraxellaceae bacterium]MBK8326664.1 phosphoglucosamine mutase [Moraxellaceae bacterium]MBL0230090.1 phosphoglucosamine mutase [Moraxellaceae bacterium]HQV79910.1 phosphoglucosamine mutase [Agitococcus sp.]
MSRKYFGTDGIRGLVGEFPIVPEFALKLGWAAGKVLASRGNPSVVIGKDTRLSGYMLEAALQSGLSAAGVNVRLLGPMPTPAVAHLARAFHASAGIVISASHNPYYDNGIKFFGATGKKLSDEIEHQIEEWLDKPMAIDNFDELGKTLRQEDARGRYIEFCKASFPYHLSLKGLKIVVDCAHGATYQVGPAVFRELGAEVVAVSCEPDGMNINADCGSTHPQTLQAAVLINKADLGIAFDGDGDRIVMVDHTGSVVDGDEIIVMIARARQQEGVNVGGVVGTVMSNMGMEVAVKNMGLEFVRAKVGDRHVMSALAKRGWMLGGEASGHIVCLDKTTTGDAIIAALQVLAAVVQSEQSLHDLRQGMTKFPQQLINVKIAQKSDPMTNDVVMAAVKEAEAVLGERGRVLLRASGTEPVIRVMVEGEQQQQITRICQDLADKVRLALS